MRNVSAIVAACALASAAHAQDLQVINARALFPGGPAMSNGKLLYAEYAGNAVTVWDGKTNTQMWKQDGCGPSAIVPMGENFGVTCYDSGQLVIISKDGKTLKSYGKDDAGGVLIGPNDGTPDGKGGAYFTLPGPWESGPIVGRVVHLTADGKLIEAANDLHYANGDHPWTGRTALCQRVGGGSCHLIQNRTVRQPVGPACVRSPLPNGGSARCLPGRH
jgi:gluconolactonase